MARVYSLSILIAFLSGAGFAQSTANLQLSKETTSPNQEQQAVSAFQTHFRTIVHDTPKGSLVIKHLTPPPRMSSAIANSQSALLPAPVVSTGIDQYVISTPSQSMLITASVSEGKGSLLEWHHQGMTYRAWSRVDFRHLEGLQTFSWKGVNYHVLLLVTSPPQTMAPAPNQEPVGEFSLVAGNASDRKALTGVQALHEFYRANQYQLTAPKPVAIKAPASRTQQAPEIIELRLWKKPSPKSSLRK